MARTLADRREIPAVRMLIEIGQEEGRVVQARQDLLELGAERLGPADAATAQAIQEIADLDTLRRLLRRILTASSWEERLGGAERRG